MSLHIKIQSAHKGAYTVVLEGSIDAETSLQFTATTNALLDQKPNRVLIDMRGVEYISSAGIGALFQFKDNLANMNAVMSLFGLQKQVRSVLEIMKIIPLENIFETEKEADNFLRYLHDLGKKFPQDDKEDVI